MNKGMVVMWYLSSILLRVSRESSHPYRERDILTNGHFSYKCKCLLQKSNFYLVFRVSPVSAASVKSLQLCPTLCEPIDGSPPGFPVPGILQARTLGVGCHFLLQCMKVKSESEVAQLCV